jgi:hypothetical protein
MILSTLFLPVQKTSTVGAPGRGICSMLFLYTFQWFILCKSTVAIGDISLFSIELTQDEAIRFKDLEFIADHFNNLNLLAEGDDSSTIIGGMACSRSPSLHAILKKSPSEDDSARSEGESSGFPIPMVCNVVTSATPIATTPPLEDTPSHQTIPVMTQRIAISQPNTRPLPEQSTTRAL